MWSCETLMVGYEDVMMDALVSEEAAVVKRLQEINAELLTVGVQQPTPCRAPLRLPEVPSDSLDQKTSEKKTEAIGEGDSKPYGASLETLPDPNLPRLDEPSGKPNDVDGEALQEPSSTTPSLAGENTPLPDSVAHDGYCLDDYVPVQPDDDDLGVNELSVQLSLALGGVAPEGVKEETHSDEEAAPPAPSTKRVLTRRERLRNAAKARIRRMVAEKRKRTDLSVPPWLKVEFERGSKQKEEMAEVLQQVNWCEEKFVDEMQRIITSRKKVSITRDEGWYSETEMKADLKWSTQRISGAKAFCAAPERVAKFVRKNMYDSVVEYWVTIRERGMHEEEHEVLEKQTSTSKADGAVVIQDGSFTNVRELMDRQAFVDKSATEAGEELKSEQNQQHFKRYMDSILQKTTKLRALLKELGDKYTTESTATSSKTLQDFIAQLDKEYDSLNEMMAKGHTDNFGTAWWEQAHAKMKNATVVSSRASAAELKVKKSKQFFQPLPETTSRLPSQPSRPGKRPKRHDQEPSVTPASRKSHKKEKKDRKKK